MRAWDVPVEKPVTWWQAGLTVVVGVAGFLVVWFITP